MFYLQTEAGDPTRVIFPLMTAAFNLDNNSTGTKLIVGENPWLLDCLLEMWMLGYI
jgi:hypothetical protein